MLNRSIFFKEFPWTTLIPFIESQIYLIEWLGKIMIWILRMEKKYIYEEFRDFTSTSMAVVQKG